MKHNVNYYKFIFIINWQDFAPEIYFASVFYGLCYLKLYKNSLQKISRLTLKRTYFTDEIAACYCSSMYSLRSLKTHICIWQEDFLHVCLPTQFGLKA